MTWVDKNGKIHERTRRWYSKSETDEIYANGGRVILTLKEDRKTKDKRILEE